MTDKPAPREVRVKPMSYRPTKADMDEPVTVRKADGSPASPEELARSLGPVKLVEDPEA